MVENKILQRPDVVWSKIKLEENEVLMVKVSKHMRPMFDDIKNMLDTVFKGKSHKVILFLDGDMEFYKAEV